MNQKGFAVVESLATMAFAAAALTGGAGLSYAAYARMFLKHASYECAVCLTTQATSLHCKQVFQREVHEALPVGELRNVIASPYRTHVDVSGSFVIPGGVSIPIEESRKLPLIGEAPPDELKKRFP